MISITPAPLTVKADDASKQYGDPMPTFTAKYIGFVLGQNPSNLAGALVFATSPAADAISLPGSYAIIPSGQSSANYSITYLNGTLTVTPPPLVGFVIGDLNGVVGQQATFWGAQWAKSNLLSGGSAPSSFKGYANSLNPNPATCGGKWTSDPGNNSGPPSSVPRYITVLVSSSITNKSE